MFITFDFCHRQEKERNNSADAGFIHDRLTVLDYVLIQRINALHFDSLSWASYDGGSIMTTMRVERTFLFDSNNDWARQKHTATKRVSIGCSDRDEWFYSLRGLTDKPRTCPESVHRRYLNPSKKASQVMILAYQTPAVLMIPMRTSSDRSHQ